MHEFVDLAEPARHRSASTPRRWPRRPTTRARTGRWVHRPRHRLRLPRRRRAAARRLAAARATSRCSATCRSPSSSRRPTTRTSGRRSASPTARRWAWARTGPTRSPASGPCSSEKPLDDADRLLARVPAAGVPPAGDRPRSASSTSPGSPSGSKAGDCFETAMRWAYRAALCSPDFLYHVEPAGKLDDHALACRLSYFFWNSMPDERLTELADAGKLREPDVLRGEVERLLARPEVAAVRRGLPRPVAEAPADRGERPGPQALPRVQHVPAGLDGRRDAGLLPRADRQGPRRRATW